MNLALWIVTALLAIAFLASGTIKLVLSKDRIEASPGGGWVEDFSANTVNGIGVLEILAAIGLILPAVVDLAPVLVPMAAVGLVLMMIGAIITHLRREEPKQAAVNMVYLALATFVAWGRFGPKDFTG
jgi:uncharacterized membrane protein YphA (DoxX/SURF4 family)